MHYVYVLQSQVDARLYVGKSHDLQARFTRHNAGGVRSTKAYRPWQLVYYEAYLNKKDASVRELQLKKHAAKEALRLQLKYSLIDGGQVAK